MGVRGDQWELGASAQSLSQVRVSIIGTEKDGREGRGGNERRARSVVKVYSQARVSIFSDAWIICSRGFEGKEAPDGTDPPSCLNMIAPYFTTAQYFSTQLRLHSKPEQLSWPAGQLVLAL